MQAEQLKERIGRIEQCADEAKRAVQAGSASPELRQSVESLHAQARQVQQAASGSQQMGQDDMRERVNQLEQSGDRAVQACRASGAKVDSQTRDAVQRTHDEISNLKKQMQ